MEALMPKNKKGVTALIWNILIGLVLIAISFLIFMGIQSKIGELENPAILDAQIVDVESSYAGFMSKINSSILIDYVKFIKIHGSDKHFSFNLDSVKKYETFRGDVAVNDEIANIVVKSELTRRGTRNTIAPEIRFVDGYLFYWENSSYWKYSIRETATTWTDSRGDTSLTKYGKFLEVIS